MKKNLFVVITALMITAFPLMGVVVSEGSSEKTTHDEHAESSVKSEHHVTEDKHPGEKDHGESDGGHGGGHHLWWTFTGYEFVIAIIGCIYYALDLKILPNLIGKHEEGHH